jgi:hypothetical protein
MSEGYTTLDRGLFEAMAEKRMLDDTFLSHNTAPEVVPLEEMSMTTVTEQVQPRQIKRSEKLFSANTVFPFTIFPDTISIDTSKVSIIRRSFFFTYQAISVRVEDILDVGLSLGPFFGSIKLHTRFYDSVQSAYHIDWLKRSDAIKIKHILHGYVIARHNGIDLSQMTYDEQLEQIIALGHE